MSSKYSQFEKRKQDHIDLALMSCNQTTELNTFDKIMLKHEAIPDLNFDEIDISSIRLNKLTKTPFIVSSMTAGHQNAINVNQNLMCAAEKSGWAMGVGSQRRELTDKNASLEWKTLREMNPNISLFGNLGISQLITTKLDDVKRLADALEADGLIIHCNPLQESIQPEGTTNFSGSYQAIENLIKYLSIPVIIKETGCGFSKTTCNRLVDIGVRVIDVSGLGGTHWGRIEGHRADSKRKIAAETFKNWGIDTVTSLYNAKQVDSTIEIWGSGGVRNGLDAAKLIAIGASNIGFAKLLLDAALKSSELVFEVMQTIEYELKIAMFCTGSKNLSDLKEKLCL
ncbi:MAG: type 2 isopentenyl-diphosphate Delta-isomerase [Legionellales bacterium RIFCSPHIGHO2_12_FULL_35_11]|nr:MAG: type 2 isopentenyl-diphosphate Delta-isomerase [Legionellales bacterium RIFCSPHIGHO2_12_FULL_35_11]